MFKKTILMCFRSLIPYLSDILTKGTSELMSALKQKFGKSFAERLLSIQSGPSKHKCSNVRFGRFTGATIEGRWKTARIVGTWCATYALFVRLKPNG